MTMAAAYGAVDSTSAPGAEPSGDEATRPQRAAPTAALVVVGGLAMLAGIGGSGAVGTVGNHPMNWVCLTILLLSGISKGLMLFGLRMMWIACSIADAAAVDVRELLAQPE